jgi:hypothetical protein
MNARGLTFAGSSLRRGAATLREMAKLRRFALAGILAAVVLVAPVASAQAEDDPNTPSSQTLSFSGTGPTTGTVTGRVAPDLEETEYGVIYAPASSLWCTSGGHEGERPTTYVDGGWLAPDPEDSYHLDNVTVNLAGLNWTPGSGYCAAITATNAAGTTPSFPVTAPYDLSTPIASGTDEPGQPLSVGPGVWSYSLFAYSYAYQWYECPTETLCGTAIAGAAGTSWTPGGADAGRYVYATVVVTNGLGSSAPAASNEIAIAGGSSSGGGGGMGEGGPGGGGGTGGGGTGGSGSGGGRTVPGGPSDSHAVLGELTSSGTTASVPVGCPASGPACAITAQLTSAGKPDATARARRLLKAAILGRATATVRPGHSTVLKVKLGTGGRRLLSAHRGLTARLTVYQRIGGKQTVLRSGTVRFKS